MLLGIGIGLSAGVGALEVALVMSLIFNYVFLALWALDYGWMEGARRYLRDKHAPSSIPSPRSRRSRRDDRRRRCGTAASLLLLAACGPAAEDAGSGRTYNLPSELTEVSGLAVGRAGQRVHP